MKKIILTFDLEEADIINQYGEYPSQKTFDLTNEGLDSLISLLDKHKIKATFFTTLTFAKKYPAKIKELIKQGHEIASHGCNHSDCYLNPKEFPKIEKAKQELEKISKTEIKGFRAPRFEIKNISQLSKYNFKYDSSIHPSFVSSKAKNLFKKINPHKIKNIIEIPPSTILGFPISWIAFKNAPAIYSKLFTKFNFFFSIYTMLLFHPWEFANLSLVKMPRYIKNPNGKQFLDKLENYIKFCKKRNYEFETIEKFLRI